MNKKIANWLLISTEGDNEKLFRELRGILSSFRGNNNDVTATAIGKNISLNRAAFSFKHDHFLKVKFLVKTNSFVNLY